MGGNKPKFDKRLHKEAPVPPHTGFDLTTPGYMPQLPGVSIRDVLSSDGTVATLGGLARICGVTKWTVSHWKKQGMPVEPDGTYCVKDILEWRRKQNPAKTQSAQLMQKYVKCQQEYADYLERYDNGIIAMVPICAGRRCPVGRSCQMPRGIQCMVRLQFLQQVFDFYMVRAPQEEGVRALFRMRIMQMMLPLWDLRCLTQIEKLAAKSMTSQEDDQPGGGGPQAFKARISASLKTDAEITQQILRMEKQLGIEEMFKRNTIEPEAARSGSGQGAVGDAGQRCKTAAEQKKHPNLEAEFLDGCPEYYDSLSEGYDNNEGG